MSSKFAAIALGTLLTVGVGAVHAGELVDEQVPWNQKPFVSTVTRAQVQAEQRAYEASTHAVPGQYPEDRVANAPEVEPHKTRAEVKAERDQALSHKAPITSPDNPYVG